MNIEVKYTTEEAELAEKYKLDHSDADSCDGYLSALIDIREGKIHTKDMYTKEKLIQLIAEFSILIQRNYNDYHGSIEFQKEQVAKWLTKP